MPTWGEIQEYVRGKYKLDKDEPGWFSLVWAYDNNRRQKIIVTKFEAFNQEWASFTSAVCKQEQMSHTVALKKNYNFAVGGLALDDQGYIIFTYSAPLATMDPDEFELPLHVVASTADKLEAEFAAGDQF